MSEARRMPTWSPRLWNRRGGLRWWGGARRGRFLRFPEGIWGLYLPKTTRSCRGWRRWWRILSILTGSCLCVPLFRMRWQERWRPDREMDCGWGWRGTTPSVSPTLRPSKDWRRMASKLSGSRLSTTKGCREISMDFGCAVVIRNCTRRDWPAMFRCAPRSRVSAKLVLRCWPNAGGSCTSRALVDA